MVFVFHLRHSPAQSQIHPAKVERHLGVRSTSSGDCLTIGPYDPAQAMRYFPEVSTFIMKPNRNQFYSRIALFESLAAKGLRRWLGLEGRTIRIASIILVHSAA